MKKIAYLLCLVILLQGCILPAAATDAASNTDETQTETTAETVPQTTLSFGNVCIQSGCRTIEGKIPLGGSDRILTSARAVFVYETSTNTVIYSYNPDTEIAPGSLVKILTALIVIENCDLEDVVTVGANVNKRPAGSQHSGLKVGEELTVNDLLYCMILNSANDAAIALAEHAAGTQDAFIALMNQRVKQIGCTNTEFTSVHGVDSSAQHTTARDMAKIVVEATKNETFMELFSADEYTVPETNKSEERTYRSQNYLKEPNTVPKYNDKYVTGGFGSYVNASTGASLACTAEYKNMNLVCVVLGCTRELYDNGWQVKYYGNFDEMVELLEYTYQNYKVNRVLFDGQTLEQFSVIGGESQVVGVSHVDIDSVLPVECQMKNLRKEYNTLDGKMIAPVEKDDVISTVSVWYGNSCLMEAEVYAMGSVRSATDSGVTIQGGASRTDADTSGFITVVSTICLIALAAVGAYLIINSLLRARRRAQRRRRRASRRRSR